jgi:hypothetical protein
MNQSGGLVPEPPQKQKWSNLTNDDTSVLTTNCYEILMVTLGFIN